jgi:predicted CXXCH cytochrome family protein
LDAVRGKTFQRSEDPLLTGDLSGGIGCQRCHGPGRAHVEAVAQGADAGAIHTAIFNPARQNRDRQVEVCMQCHLETTSRRLPYSVARFDRDPFSYSPSEPLEDFILHFDYPQGVKDDRFEIAHAAYRLRKSECFLESEMTCTTCHNPHGVVRGEAAKMYFTNACKTCHADDALAQIPNHANAADCQTCHMPKRRTDDVVHVVMTDHYIQRRPPSGDLLAAIEEVTETAENVYQGPVEPYYPAQIGSDPEDQLYLAVAQVTQRANLDAGTARLRSLIEQHQPEQADFYFQLAEAYWNQQKLDEALPWYEQAVQRDPQHLIALRNYATVLAEAGRHSQSEQIVRQALEIAPDDPKALNNLGDVLVTLGRAPAAVPVLTKSLEGDPDSPEALQNLARAYGETGDAARAVEAARQSIRVRPDFAAAHNTLANLLVEQRQFAEAEQEFQKALELDPNSAIAHYNYANLLAAQEQFADAERQLREAVRIAPTMAVGHRNLGNLLGMRGDAVGAERMFRRAIEIDPNDPESHYNLGNALAAQSRVAEASQSFRRAVELRPRYDQARVNLAITLFTLGDETAAREEVTLIGDPVLRGRAQQAMSGQ